MNYRITIEGSGENGADLAREFIGKLKEHGHAIYLNEFQHSHGTGGRTETLVARTPGTPQDIQAAPQVREITNPNADPHATHQPRQGSQQKQSTEQKAQETTTIQDLKTGASHPAAKELGDQLKQEQAANEKAAREGKAAEGRQKATERHR